MNTTNNKRKAVAEPIGKYAVKKWKKSIDYNEDIEHMDIDDDVSISQCIYNCELFALG